MSILTRSSKEKRKKLKWIFCQVIAISTSTSFRNQALHTSSVDLLFVSINQKALVSRRIAHFEEHGWRVRIGRTKVSVRTTKVTQLVTYLPADICLFESKPKGSGGYPARAFPGSITLNVWLRADNLDSLKKNSLLFWLLCDPQKHWHWVSNDFSPRSTNRNKILK